VIGIELAAVTMTIVIRTSGARIEIFRRRVDTSPMMANAPKR